MTLRLLCLEGIYSQGLGIIPKYVMFDKDLTLTSKAIYALFCSYGGEFGFCIPQRKAFLDYLKINKDTYYKHRKILIENGYISLRYKPKPEDHTQTLIILENHPKKFTGATLDIPPKPYKRIILYDGLMLAGVGSVARMVMVDTSLTVRDKGIYAYLVAYVGTENDAFPDVSKVTEDLQISESTYRRAMHNLKKANYIRKGCKGYLI